MIITKLCVHPYYTVCPSYFEYIWLQKENMYQTTIGITYLMNIAMKNIPYLMFYFLFDFMLCSCHIIYYKILHGLQQHGLVTHIPARQKKQQKTTHFPISICREYLNPYLETSGTSTSNCLGLKMWFPIRNDYFIMALL